MTSPLPHGLKIFADAAGVDAAFEIALARGGTRLSIPEKAEGAQLVEIVGIDAARKIVDELAGELIEIPLAPRLLSDWLRDKGYSQEKRAQMLRKSRRMIQHYDSGTTPKLQRDLFDPAA